MKKQLNLRFWDFAPTPEEQCREQGYTLGDKAKRFERIFKARNELYYEGFLEDAQDGKICQSISDAIAKAAVPLEAENG